MAAGIARLRPVSARLTQPIACVLELSSQSRLKPAVPKHAWAAVARQSVVSGASTPVVIGAVSAVGVGLLPPAACVRAQDAPAAEVAALKPCAIPAFAVRVRSTITVSWNKTRDAVATRAAAPLVPV